jgi:hypothetical protein
MASALASAMATDPLTGAVTQPSDAVQTGFGKVIDGLIAGAKNWATLPGRAYQEGITTDQAVDWAAPTAMGMIGMGRMPGATPAGALGSSGAKLVQPEGIRAYHGSPHDFDAFDLSKIGTGEGAQAYGHGLYFAENPKVAESYKGVVPNGLSPLNPANFWTPAMVPSGKGHMYEVNINAKPEQFLDWDKPLPADSPVRDAASSALISPGMFTFEPERTLRAMRKERVLSPETTGGDVYNTLARGLAEGKGFNQGAATDIIREAGVPGIRYLDQGSRTAGAGSSNYVVFNPKIIDIMRKYGLAGIPGASAVAAAMNDQQQQ